MLQFIKSKKLYLYTTSIFSFVFSFLPISVNAQITAPELPGGGITLNLTRENIYELLVSIAQLAVFIIPGVTLLFIIWGAFKLTTGDSETGWKIIKNALIGLAIAALSFLVIALITGLIERIYDGTLFDLV